MREIKIISTSNLKSSKWGKTTPLSDIDKVRIECGIDEGFRKKFMANPVAVLKEHGIDVPEGLAINVVEDTPTVYNISIPPYRE